MERRQPVLKQYWLNPNSFPSWFSDVPGARGDRGRIQRVAALIQVGIFVPPAVKTELTEAELACTLVVSLTARGTEDAGGGPHGDRVCLQHIHAIAGGASRRETTEPRSATGTLGVSLHCPSPDNTRRDTV
jgi:hypothetical protein